MQVYHYLFPKKRKKDLQKGIFCGTIYVKFDKGYEESK